MKVLVNDINLFYIQYGKIKIGKQSSCKKIYAHVNDF